TVNAGAGGTLTISTVANPRINKVLLNTALTSPLNIILPPATNYGSAFGFEPIEIVDVLGGAAQTTNNKRITVTRSSTDTIDGGLTSIQLPQGVTYASLTPDVNGTKWTSTYYSVNSVKDPTDATKAFVF